MRFLPPLTAGRLIRRYKRFLADVELADGRVVVAHCPNPGAGTGLFDPGNRAWISHSDKPGRKLAWTLELVEADGVLVGVDTGRANALVAEGHAEGRIAWLAACPVMRREVRYGKASRVDFLFNGPGCADFHVEVKNVHLMRTPGRAEFPDSVTARGARHLDELAGVVRAGGRAALLYVIQRPDCDHVRVAADLDPAYAAAFARALLAGVEARAHLCEITTDGITLAREVPVIFP